MCTIGTAKLEQTVTHYPTILLVFIAHLYLPIWIPFWQSAVFNDPYTPLIPRKIGHYDAEGEKCSCPQSDRFNRDSQLDNMWERDASNIRGDYCRESCPLFRVLRYRTPSSPIHLSEVTEQALRLIARIPLIQRREKHRSHEEKSTFP